MRFMTVQVAPMLGAAVVTGGLGIIWHGLLFASAAYAGCALWSAFTDSNIAEKRIVDVDA